jgi:hypothetical protein
MRCGNCKNSHETVAEVRSCHTQGFLGLDSNTPEPPTGKQLDYAHSLFRQRVAFGDVAQIEEVSGAEAAHEAISAMDRKSCSEFISSMLEQPKREFEKRTSQVAVGEGMYKMDDVIYKVQVAHHGSGHLYAKQLKITPAEKCLCSDLQGVMCTPCRNGTNAARGSFVRASGVLTRLRPEHKMSLKEAKQFGALYGFCVRCGAILTDEVSIEAGIGPVCAGKDDWA